MFALGNAMTKFNGLNYADWSEKIQFQLGVMNLDMALIMDEKPAAITEDSTEDEKALLEDWERDSEWTNALEGQLALEAFLLRVAKAAF
ncbi:hypothetical protein KIW84_061138 [Lathyrus oleraceus]|uniref:Uncharacterized protein n=1 Tax=Pisum sativum TaxID=3888 RepID=A0A9D4W1K8_PEA|nr:hypothetical protein KIW84_061138 [Pisum sativum]